MKNRIFLAIALLFCTSGANAQAIEKRLQHIADSFYQAIPNTTGIVIHVAAPDEQLSWSYATGYADKNTKQLLAADQPVLIASNTKTYVAAAILKLCEQGKVALEDPVGPLISERSRILLQNDGYELDAIHIRHLLSHSSGISDYTEGDYFDFVNTHRQYHWTRDEQIERTVEITQPLAAPGDTFKYADVNYLLLTEIIEQQTHKPFYTAIRALLGYNRLKLRQTWFTELEPSPEDGKELAHQYWSKYPWDSYDLDPSWDLYGGGGIAATAADLAWFFQYLFEGRIVQDKQLLRAMHTEVLNHYCLGVKNIQVGGLEAWYHGGFWGTDAAYFPALNCSVSVFILQKDERDKGGAICKEIVTALQQH
ncbi:MAG: serine hydrolase [Chitinophagaceae bacterium]|nr:serine hydrolase [Chitinophagaceae bacterium]